jgi:uncharacterized HAD superfamily protein
MRKIKGLNAIYPGKKLTIAIDIDGTVADCSRVDLSLVNAHPEEFLKAVPLKGAQNAVKRLHKDGHIIVFHTSRNYTSKQITKKWLTRHDFPFHYIVMDKFVAHVYVDDRAINGCNWNRVMRTMKNPKLPGKIARKKGML